MFFFASSQSASNTAKDVKKKRCMLFANFFQLPHQGCKNTTSRKCRQIVSKSKNLFWCWCRLAWRANVCSRNNPDSARGQKSKCKFDNVYFRVKRAVGWCGEIKVYEEKFWRAQAKQKKELLLYRFQIEHLRGNKEKIADEAKEYMRDKKPTQRWNRLMRLGLGDWDSRLFFLVRSLRVNLKIRRIFLSNFRWILSMLYLLKSLSSIS